jgi:hypothetical protein
MNTETKHEERTKAKPEELPSPTYWPFFTALGLLFLAWGIIAGWIILIAGFIVFAIALAAWINILRHELRNK